MVKRSAIHLVALAPSGPYTIWPVVGDGKLDKSSRPIALQYQGGAATNAH